MEIRRLRPEDDRLAVARIYEESWRYAYKGIVPQDYLDGLRSEQWVPNLGREGLFHLLAEENGVFVGTVSFCGSRLEEYADFGEIVSLYLLPQFIGRGYGRRLLAAALGELGEMGFRDVFLWVLEENRRARDFYERYGFSQSGESLTHSVGGKDLTEIMYRIHIA